jgi:hypothetical protein
VQSIVYARLGARYQGKDETSRRIADAVGFFRFLRQEETGLERRPTLAERLDWLDYLMPQRSPCRSGVPAARVDSVSLRTASVANYADRELLG